MVFRQKEGQRVLYLVSDPPDSRQVIDFQVGDRSRKSARAL